MAAADFGVMPTGSKRPELEARDAGRRQMKNQLAAALTSCTVPGCVSLPLLVVVLWLWPQRASSSLRLAAFVLALGLLIAVFLWIVRETRLAQVRNRALDAHLDEVEAAVRSKLKAVDQATLGDDLRLGTHVRDLFFDEWRKSAIDSAGLSGSAGWDRALLISNIQPRLDQLIDLVRQKRERQSKGPT